MEPVTARPALERRIVRWVPAAVGLLLVALASFTVTFFVAFWASWSCSLGFDTSTTPPPADASPQGLLCGEHASMLGMWIWNGGWLASVVVTVVLIGLAWRRWSWRAGVPALALVVVVPALTAWLLTLPSDDCTARARASQPVWACGRGT